MTQKREGVMPFSDFIGKELTMPIRILYNDYALPK